jgi:hypothetical protein
MRAVYMALCLILVAGFAWSAGGQAQTGATVTQQIEQDVTTVPEQNSPHPGLTEAEKAKLEDAKAVSSEKSEEVRIPDLPQAEPNAVEATGKRARPVAHEGEGLRASEPTRPYQGMTEAELEKANLPITPTSNQDGIDIGDEVPVPGNPAE